MPSSFIRFAPKLSQRSVAVLCALSCLCLPFGPAAAHAGARNHLGLEGLGDFSTDGSAKFVSLTVVESIYVKGIQDGDQQKAPPAKEADIFVNISLDLQALHPGDREALKSRLRSGVSELFTRLSIPPARGPEDLKLRAIVDKNENEGGELGYAVRYEGAHREQAVDFQHPPMRCNLCTDGEFVDRFVEDLEALLSEWKTRRNAELEAGALAAAQSQEEQEGAAQAAAPGWTLSEDAVERNHKRRVTPAASETRPRDQEGLQFRPSGRGKLELKGWLGIGLTVGGLAGIGASLLTMPRNQVDPENPSKRDRYTPNNATYIGTTLGAAAVIGGVILLIQDLRD